MRLLLASLILVLACGDDDAVPPAMDLDGGAGDGDFLASCVYENSFSSSTECVEYRGGTWDATSAEDACRRVFLRQPGELTLDAACELPSEIGRCVVGDLDADGYVIVSSGAPDACGGARTGCETFAGGTFTPDPVCNSCAAGTEEGVPFTPWFTDCREVDGAEVCTPTLISGSTEPGRRYVDFADCDVVRTQRPYYGMPAEAPDDPEDSRLEDEDYMRELEWLRDQANASACACCHQGSQTPDGASVWDTDAGPLWIDTVSDPALAMIAGYTDSAAFGFLPAEENNGFDRSTTGLPTTDVERLRAFAEVELARRGLSVEDAEAQEPFAPFFRDLIEFEPEPCEEGVGIAEDGTLEWTGGGARYVYVLEADATSPGVPPNWDTPEDTLWLLAADPEGDPMGCDMAYGEVPAGATQRIPEEGPRPRRWSPGRRTTSTCCGTWCSRSRAASSRHHERAPRGSLGRASRSDEARVALAARVRSRRRADGAAAGAGRGGGGLRRRGGRARGGLRALVQQLALPRRRRAEGLARPRDAGDRRARRGPRVGPRGMRRADARGPRRAGQELLHGQAPQDAGELRRSDARQWRDHAGAEALRRRVDRVAVSVAAWTPRRCVGDDSAPWARRERCMRKL